MSENIEFMEYDEMTEAQRRAVIDNTRAYCESSFNRREGNRHLPFVEWKGRELMERQPKRVTVELRTPKAGEVTLNDLAKDKTYTWECPPPPIAKRWVIVPDDK